MRDVAEILLVGDDGKPMTRLIAFGVETVSKVGLTATIAEPEDGEDGEEG